jgi:hypothetical protein
MQESQMVGLDLPLKLLVWEDATGVTRLTYEDPHRIAARHCFHAGAPVVDAMAALVVMVAEQAAAGQAAGDGGSADPVKCAGPSPAAAARPAFPT